MNIQPNKYTININDLMEFYYISWHTSIPGALGFFLSPFDLNRVGYFVKQLTMFCFRFHPDKNANDPKAADLFKEATFSYNLLSDPDKRRQYDSYGFEVI